MSGRPSALDRTLNLSARQIFLYACLQGFLNMKLLLHEFCTGFAESRLWECRVFSFKIACTSQKYRVFPFTFAPTCRQSLVCFACFVHLWVILCLCAAVCGRQFLSRVDILMQFYGVCSEPFMGMPCFFVETWMFIIKVSCFSVHFCPQLSLIPCFVCIGLHILQIFV